MRATALAGLAAGLIVAAALPAADPPPPDVRPLVAALASANYREREAAGKKLLALGDRGLPPLKAELPRVDDPEARRRVQVIVEKLEMDRLLSPRRVTLVGKKVPAKQALADIARQTGYRINADNLGDPDPRRADYALTDVPFWQAVDAVCNAGGLSAEPTDDGTLQVQPTDTYTPHVAYVGPFRVVATGISVSANSQLSNLPRNRPAEVGRYVGLNLQVYAEPKLPLVGVAPAVTVAAADDTGRSLRPAGQEDHQPANPSGRSFSLSTAAGLGTPDRRADTVKEVRGRVTVLALTDVRPEVTIPNLLAAKSHRAAGRTVAVALSDVAQDADGVKLTARLQPRAADPNDGQWVANLLGRVAGLDAKGNRLIPVCNSVEQNGAGGAVLGLLFPPAAGKPTAFVVDEWRTVARELEFTFRDLPLP